MRTKSFLSWALLSLFFFNHAVSAAPAAAPADVYLGPGDVESHPSYKKILAANSELMVERAKIDFLITRVKQSKCSFIRNGETHTGPRAAMHLMWKYRRKLDSVKTAEEFIQKLASGSHMTGEPYYIKCPDGNVFLARDIFYNELKRLNALLNPPAPEPSVSPSPAVLAAADAPSPSPAS